MGPLLEKERHLLHLPPEGGGEGGGASAKGMWELHPNRLWHPPAAPCSAQMLQLQTHLCKGIFSYKGATAMSVSQPDLYKEAGPTAKAGLMM